MRIIGISGVARAGKDTLAQALKVNLTKKGHKVEIASLAAPLKSMMESFVKDHFHIDIWGCNDKDKSTIRPLLVAFGGAKRKSTEGRFWTMQMDKKLVEFKEKGCDFVIIPDIRYVEYDFDELQWLRGYNGCLFHVERTLEDGSKVLPPNEDEERNDPFLQKAADYDVRWGNMNFDECCKYVKPYAEVYLENERFKQN